MEYRIDSGAEKKRPGLKALSPATAVILSDG